MIRYGHHRESTAFIHACAWAWRESQDAFVGVAGAGYGGEWGLKLLSKREAVRPKRGAGFRADQGGIEIKRGAELVPVVKTGASKPLGA